MGICGGGDPEGGIVDPATRRSSRVVEKALLEGIQQNAMKKTLLLLGAGESGKSTIFKQVQVIHSGGYTDEQIQQFRFIIQRNTLDGIKILIREAQSRDLELTAENEDLADQILLWDGENLNPELGANIDKVWKDSGIKDCFSRRAEFQLGDSVVYFLNAVERLSKNDYVPTVDDVLRARVRTSGVVAKDFKIKKASFRLYDVGGQRSERRRWLQFFDHVTSIVFIAAISEYDQVTPPHVTLLACQTLLPPLTPARQADCLQSKAASRKSLLVAGSHTHALLYP